MEGELKIQVKEKATRQSIRKYVYCAHSNALKASLPLWKHKRCKENSCPMVPQSGPIAESFSVLKKSLNTRKVDFGLPAMH